MSLVMYRGPLDCHQSPDGYTSLLCTRAPRRLFIETYGLIVQRQELETSCK